MQRALLRGAAGVAGDQAAAACAARAGRLGARLEVAQQGVVREVLHQSCLGSFPGPLAEGHQVPLVRERCVVRFRVRNLPGPAGLRGCLEFLLDLAARSRCMSHCIVLHTGSGCPGVRGVCVCVICTRASCRKALQQMQNSHNPGMQHRIGTPPRLVFSVVFHICIFSYFARRQERGRHPQRLDVRESKGVVLLRARQGQCPARAPAPQGRRRPPGRNVCARSLSFVQVVSLKVALCRQMSRGLGKWLRFWQVAHSAGSLVMFMLFQQDSSSWSCSCFGGVPGDLRRLQADGSFLASNKEGLLTRRSLTGRWWCEEYEVIKVMYAVKPDGDRKAPSPSCSTHGSGSVSVWRVGALVFGLVRCCRVFCRI